MREILLLFVYLLVGMALVPWAIYASLGTLLGLFEGLLSPLAAMAASYVAAFVMFCLCWKWSQAPARLLINLAAGGAVFLAMLFGGEPSFALVAFGVPAGVLWFAVIITLMWLFDRLSGSSEPFPLGPRAHAERQAQQLAREQTVVRKQKHAGRMATAETDILELIARDQGLRAPAIAAALDLPLSAVRPLLQALADSGRLNAESTAHGLDYHPVED